MKKHIFLIGFMGCGKSSVAAKLCELLKLTQIEMDARIVEEQGMAIADIFEQYGEEHFRDIETELLKCIGREDGAVISCGGGAVVRRENREIMKSCGLVVLLTAEPATVYERVRDSGERPLLNQDMSVAHIQILMDKRRALYLEAADVTVATDQQGIEEICREIIEKIGL